MMRYAPFVLAVSLLVFPHFTHAATLVTGRTITVASSTPDNAYYAGGQVTVDALLPADLCAVAGTVTISAPIAGDAMLVGGTVDLQKPVAGDVRVVGGRVIVDDNVGGDLLAAGGFVTVSGKAKDAYLAGGTVDMTNGSNGDVTIYGADVYLSGVYNGDVQVVASDRVSLAEGTVIHGTFKYNAPQQAGIPASAVVDKGVTYTGAESYLPTAQEAKTFALAGLWVFILVRITAGLVAAGLIAGLFPVLTDRVVETALMRTPERFILMTLLGFAGFVAAPVLILFLVVSFVGIGVALIVGATYFLFLLLSYVYAAVLAGAACLHFIRKDIPVTWRTAILGVVVLYIIGIIPYIGFLTMAVLCATAGGALLTLAYRFAFRRGAFDINDL